MTTSMKPLSAAPLLTIVVAICCLTGTPTSLRVAAAPAGSWLPQKFRDEFNSTTAIIGEQSNTGWLRAQNEIDSLQANHGPSQRSSASAKLPGALRRVLDKYDLSSPTSCCPSWRNLTQNSEIQDEQRRFYGKTKTNQLRLVDLLVELKRSYANITFLSIDGQPGDSEQEKYYRFLDDVQYYLKLHKIAANYLDEQPPGKEAAGNKSASSKQQQPDTQTTDETPEFKRLFRRQLKAIEFKISQDPTISSFINEFTSAASGGGTFAEAPTTKENPFAMYDTFIRYTRFGQQYAQNVSLIRESVLVFDQVCSHLNRLSFPSNLTRPSVQYEMIRRLSYELFLIRNELREQINERVLENRSDIRRIFQRLDRLVASRPEIRLLGDEFSSSPPYFSTNVRELTRLLDLYTSNSLTELSFYDQLSELPEDFIMLGATIAHEYETREIPQFSRFDSDYYNWHFSRHRLSYQRQQYEDGSSDPNNGTSASGEARSQSNKSLLSRLFS